jgi:ABC-2 type transport system permease protein
VRDLLAFEWRVLRRDRTVWLVATVFLALGAYASATGARVAAERHQAIAELVEEQRLRLDSLAILVPRLEAGAVRVPAFQDPRVPAIAGRGTASQYAILPPGPLAPLAIGQSDVQPFWALVTTRTKQTFFVNDEIENPGRLLTGRLDVAFVMLIVFPLLVLALTFDVVSGERERGTLALVLAQPVEARSVLGAKLGLRALVVAGMAVLLTAGAAVATGMPLTEAATLFRLAAWCGVVLLYGAFWFAVALAVNARRLSAAASAVVLLGVWLVVVVVLPALAAAAISVTHPAPSRITLTTQLREATDAAAARRQDAIATFLLDHPGHVADTGVAADPYVTATALQDAAERTMAPHYAAFDAALDAQRRAAERFRLMSPALVVQGVLLDVTGTGEHRFRHYETQFDRYHAAWREAFTTRMLRRERLTAADLAALPQWTFVEEGWSSLGTRLTPGVLLLVALVLGIGVPSWRRLDRAAAMT